jgi:hypothetical protein
VLSDKLVIKPGFKCLVINSPQGYLEQLGTLPQGAVISQTMPGKEANFDFIQLFVVSVREIHTLGTAVLKAARENGVLWISYPKKGGGLETDLSRDICCTEMKAYGLEPVSQVAVDDTWSALRFKPREAVSRKSATQVPEIDYQNRLVFLPDDFQKALEDVGLLEKFKSLSFTHQKEHVLAVVTSKKPETRSKRIQKNISMLKEIV